MPLPANFGPQPGEHQAHAESYYRQLFSDHGESFDRWRASYAVYWGFVTMIDHFIGKLIDTLTKEDLMQETIILFTSDHGENLGAHGLWQKMVPFDESIRVPLVMRIPGQAGAGRVVTPVSLIDLAPTLAGLCNLPGGTWQGRDIWQGDMDAAGHPAIYAMHQPIGDWMNVTDWRLVQEGGFKYVWHNGMKEELFDLGADPGECSNLADNPEHQGRLLALRLQLDRFLNETNDPLLPQWRLQAGRASGPASPH